MTEVKYQLNKFEKALKRLHDALNIDTDLDILTDAVIQRFEFTFEMAWKSIRVVLKYFGRNCTSPRNCLRAAYQEGWIDDEKSWLQLLEARNKTSHTYNQSIAEEVYETVKEKVWMFDNLLENLKKYTV